MQHGWQSQATREPEQITQWWTAIPAANVGVAIVPGCGYWVLDVDPRNGGDAELDRLEAEHGRLPETLTVLTGGGGVHFYFARPEGDIRWRGKIARGLDVKADGGGGSNLVGPGSAHASGKVYELIDPEAPIATAPAWLFEMATRRAAPVVGVVTEWAPIEHGEELADLLDYARWRTDRRAPGKADGSGGTTCLVAARFLWVELGLSDEHARPIFDTWLTRCNPPWDDETQIQHKIADAKRSTSVKLGSGLVDFRIKRALQKKFPNGPPEIKIRTKENEVVDEVVDAIAAHPDLYRRSGMLVEAMLDEEGSKIRQTPGARIREIITACCDLKKFDKKSAEWIPSHPPEWLVQEVAARAAWPGVQRLSGIVECPTILDDGRILSKRGYDSDSGLYLTTDLEVDVPDRPNRGDAERAATDLLDLVSEVPFASDEHRAAWLCAYLTVMSRHAFTGPAPLMLFDAPAAASGKTLLADLISIFARGRAAARTTYTEDDAETRKKITTEAMAGTRMLLFDNLENGAQLKSPALDAALTSEIWSDRILGVNAKWEGALKCVWFATGNNISVGGDMARRTLSVRIEPREDRPEERSGFRRKLPDEAYPGRSRYVSDALTVLRAFHMAGRPNGHLKPWGSFSGWSEMPRAAVAWCGLPDPGETRGGFAEVADRSRQEAATMIAEMRRLFGSRHFSIKEIMEASYGPSGAAAFSLGAGQAPRSDALREALDELTNQRTGQKPTPKHVSWVLRKFRGRRFEGWTLTCNTDAHTKCAMWKIEK